MIIDRIKTRSAEVRALALRDSAFKTDSLFLITLLSEIERVGFDDGKRKTTDAEAVVVLNKFLKNANATIELLSKSPSDHEAKLEELKAEISWIQAYLPPQMTSDDMLNVVKNFVVDKDRSDKRLMGAIMSHFKSEYAGLYDSKLLASTIKQVLES